MLAVAVPAQIDFALERLVAEAALERFVAGMLSHVRNQVGALAEGFVANDARVRFFACGNGGDAEEMVIMVLEHL